MPEIYALVNAVMGNSEKSGFYGPFKGGIEEATAKLEKEGWEGSHLQYQLVDRDPCSPPEVLFFATIGSFHYGTVRENLRPARQLPI